MWNRIRTGHGYDAHRFADAFIPSKPFVLGGVSIAHERSLLAHSDGDAVIHALCDALLGAVGKGDIGRHFPDTDAEFENIDSAILLQKVCSFLHAESWLIGNVDITILAQAPRMSPHIEAMCARLAQLMSIAPEQVNVKASTTEGMGFVGRKEGIESYAAVLVYKEAPAR